MSTPHLYGAVSALLFNDAGEILLNKRQNTGFLDGSWGLVGGHIEKHESSSAALIREVKEETTIDILEANILPHHVIHKHTQGTQKEYFLISFEIKQRTGEIHIGEPEYCSALEWFSCDQLPENILPGSKHFIQARKENRSGFSEMERSH